jgi:type IV pilus assembly protein PilY1
MRNKIRQMNGLSGHTFSSRDRKTGQSRSEQHREGTMNGNWETHFRMGLRMIALAAGLGCWGLSLTESIAAPPPPPPPPAPQMVNYTNYPMFLNKTGPVNILFLVDISNATLEAAYTGSNLTYPISLKTGTVTDGKYAANVTVDSNAGIDLVAVDSNGVAISSATASVSSPADTFVSSKKYFGIFDPYRCYTANSTTFTYAWRKVDSSGNPDYTVNCNATNQWDGNFLNWLTMRKQEMIYQALIGGRPLPAQANTDGTANSLAGARAVGENGSSLKCSGGSNTGWCFVKFVPAATLTGRVPTGLPTSDVSLAGGGTITAATGRFFGMGDGTGQGNIYVNDNTTANPFDTASTNQHPIEVDLTSEPNDVPASGLANTCILGDPNYMGTTACYLRDRSWGLFQRLRTDAFRAAIMFVNGSTGQGGSLQIAFDSAVLQNDYTNIRNEPTLTNAPLAESLYEALCYYRKSSGPCYNNGSGAWSTGYNSTTAAAGDPYYVSSAGAIVPCCRNFVLMISPGVGVADGDAPGVQPFGNLFSGTNIGVDYTQPPASLTATAAAQAGDRLDDVAFYGHTNDVRSTIAGTQTVTFYAVNAMGGKTGAKILASAAKYGAFNDKNKDNTSLFAPTSTDYAADPNNVQVCNYPAGSNLQPSTAGPYYSYKEWDADATPDCTPDAFFDASDGGDIENEVNKAIADILKNAASGTSLSVLASSTSGDGSMYQAYFYPEEFDTVGTTTTEVRWTGYVQGLWVDTFGNMREDTVNDGRLVFADDNIIETCLDSNNTTKFLRYPDTNGDGQKNDGSTTLTCDANGIDLREMKGIWEGGKQLAKRDLSAKPRKIFTWVDIDNDGQVGISEQKDFVIGGTGMSSDQWKPYLQATATGTFTADNIISYVTGTAVTNMRNRTKPIPGESGTYVWRLGDIVNSTPTLVGAPQERFDVLYGDTGYRSFSQRWATRRLTVYVGANDGMLHAFNAGYSHRGDNAGTTEVEHGYYTTGPTANDPTKPGLGEELWAFIPYYLLPQLRWMAQDDYTHVSYVDLKAKATDVRIFSPEAACGTTLVPTPTDPNCFHPDGWGTILIVGLRYGGSCGACAAVSNGNNGGPPLTYNADFNNNGNTTDANDTRTFYSGYVVLDVTDPDNPKVLNAFTSGSLGLTTSYPTVVRVSQKDAAKTDHTTAKWYMVAGSGPHGYDGKVAAAAYIFAAELVLPGASTRVTATMPVLDDFSGSSGTANASFMANPITYDRDLDFRSDAVYVGRSIAATGTHTTWWGKFYRLMMGQCSVTPCIPDTATGTWGIQGKVSGTRVPTEIIEQVPIGGSLVDLGPVTSSATVTLDNAGNSWVFFGTGRYFGLVDKTSTDRQYLVGVKDKVVAGTCPPGSPPGAQTLTNCLHQNLTDVTGVTVSGNSVTGASSTTFSGLLTDVSATDGWVIQLAAADTTAGTAAERVIVNPTLIGGALFAPTFVPYTDACSASGKSFIYATYYLTGTGYPDPILMDSSGTGVRRVSAGEGVASSVAIQIGAEPTGMAGYFQSSNSLLQKLSPKAPATVWSQFLSWNSERT